MVLLLSYTDFSLIWGLRLASWCANSFWVNMIEVLIVAHNVTVAQCQFLVKHRSICMCSEFPFFSPSTHKSEISAAVFIE